MKPVLEVEQLSGGYSMRRPVLHELSFAVKPGEMIGLIGLNGAGKSTTIKHILGLMQAQRGEVRIQGDTLAQAPERYRASFAYVPENPLFYEELTVREHLELAAMAYGVSQADYQLRVEELADEFRMKDKLDSFARHLSKGMRQKLMIMSAFLVRPALYVIDEPFLGLDPLGIRSLLELMMKMKQTGASILMSSHILSAIESYCDRFIVLHHGRIVSQGTLEEVRVAARKPGAPLEEVFYAFVQQQI